MTYKRLILMLLLIALFSVQIENRNEAVIETEGGYLYGTLLPGPLGKDAPIALILAGSGATDRDGNASSGGMRNDSLKWLAYELKNRGIASLRYDKRTAGKSAEAFSEKNLVFDDFVTDAVSALGYLKSLGYDNIYIIGHSQGSLVGLLAARQEPVSGVVSLAGAGQPIDRILEYQFKNLSISLAEESSRITEGLRNGTPVDAMSEEAKEFFSTDNQAFLLSWMAYDPAVEAAKLSIPLLFINGTTDIQVPTSELDLFSKKVPQASFLVIENMNHVLKSAPDNRKENLKRYTDPSYELAAELGKALEKFIR